MAQRASSAPRKSSTAARCTRAPPTSCTGQLGSNASKMVTVCRESTDAYGQRHQIHAVLVQSVRNVTVQSDEDNHQVQPRQRRAQDAQLSHISDVSFRAAWHDVLRAAEDGGVGDSSHVGRQKAVHQAVRAHGHHVGSALALSKENPHVAPTGAQPGCRHDKRTRIRQDHGAGT